MRLNNKKWKTLRMNGKRDKVKVGEDEVEEFVYLGAILTTAGGSQDIKNRKNKARGAYGRLGKVLVP